MRRKALAISILVLVVGLVAGVVWPMGGNVFAARMPLDDAVAASLIVQSLPIGTPKNEARAWIVAQGMGEPFIWDDELVVLLHCPQPLFSMIATSRQIRFKFQSEQLASVTVKTMLTGP